MELQNFKLDDISNLDLQSNEVKNWMDLCQLTNAINAATFDPSKETILESFIRKYPPIQHRIDYYNTINVLTFGLLFTNRKEVLEKDIKLNEFEDLLLKATPFYYEFLDNHFKKSFIESMDKDHDIAYFIHHIVKHMAEKHNDSWLKIKTQYEFIKLNSDLSENLEKKHLQKKKL
jgi:hypothetical protein